MTEVASLVPTDHRLATVRHYEAGPPQGLELVSVILNCNNNTHHPT